MSQFQWQTIDPNTTSGTQLADRLNQGEAALHSQHGGSVRPSYAVPGMLWLDTTDPEFWLLNMYVSPGEGDAQVGTITTGTAKFSSTVDAFFVTYNPAGSNLTATNVQGAIDQLDSRKLDLTGGAMTGQLNMGLQQIRSLGNPTSLSDAANKTYVDTADNLRVNKTGGTMSGNLNMGTTNKVTQLADPTNNLDAANKRYVDNNSIGDGVNAQNGWRIIGPIKIQWGRVVTTGTGPTTVNFPSTFSGNAYTVTATAGASIADFATVVVWNITNSSFTVRTGANVNQANWFAVGLA